MQECPFFSFALSLDMDLLRSDYYQTKTFVSSLNSRFIQSSQHEKGTQRPGAYAIEAEAVNGVRRWVPWDRQ